MTEANTLYNTIRLYQRSNHKLNRDGEDSAFHLKKRDDTFLTKHTISQFISLKYSDENQMSVSIKNNNIN